MNEGRRTEKFPALLLLWHIQNQQKITQAATISFPKGVNASPVWGIERSGFFNDRGKWVKSFENQRV